MHKNKIFIIFDLEATCWDKENNSEIKPKGFDNEIIEIGAVKVNQNGEILDTFELFLKPKMFPYISKFCNKLTTITQKDIDDAIDAKTGLLEFFAWTSTEQFDLQTDYEEPIFISWGHYDRLQFRKDLHLNGLDKNIISQLNHQSLKHLHSEWNQLKYPKGVGLGSACKFENIIFEGTAHRGIDDAKMVGKIFNKYLYKFI